MIKQEWMDTAIAVMLVVVGAWFGYALASSTARKNAIDQSCAHYDAKTGEFKWGQVQ